MLKQRLLFGTIMLAVFAGLIYLDCRMVFGPENKSVVGTIFALIIFLMVVPAQLEFKNLAARKGASVFAPLTIVCSILFAGSWYFRQFCSEPLQFHLFYLLAVSVLTVAGSFVYQARLFGTEGTITNCSTSICSAFYLGFLSSFVLGIRIEFGIAALLMYIITVKSSDIGAYTLGKLIGKHKFAPRISPGKTWEGMLGACIFAGAVGFGFTRIVAGLEWWHGVLFGVVFAFLGQLGDLAESMLKRDSQMKDPGSGIPGFGGVLDVIDSPLMTAPFAYLFFMLTMRCLGQG